MNNNSDEPAFPWEINKGLTKRDYFAAMAMQGVLGSDARYAERLIAEIAKEAVYAADQLLHELAKARAE